MNTYPFEVEEKVKKCPAYNINIYIGGEYYILKQVLIDYCSVNGSCFTLSKAEYIYSGGQEDGVIITLINYARFPELENELDEMATDLVYKLMHKAGQGSASLVTPKESYYFSRRKGDG